MKLNRHYGHFGSLIGLAAVLALTVTPVLAEDSASQPESGRDRSEAQLAEAQARLEAAAREIAELTARIMGEVGIGAIARIEELARRPRPVMLGVTIGPVGEEAAREDGVSVLGVTPGSSADEAGIRSGDILMSLGKTRLDWSGDSSPVRKMLDELQAVEPGSEVELAYVRDGRSATVMVEARPWSWTQAFHFDNDHARMAPPPGVPRPPAPPRPTAFVRQLMADRWGDMELVALSPELGEYFKASEGVLVVRAPAEPSLGLQDGDVIVDIAGRTPMSPGHVARILRSYAPGERLVMTIIRHGERQQLEADVPAQAERG